VLGAGSFLAWKYFVVGLLLAYTLNVTFTWKFAGLELVDATGRNLLWPLRWLPLGIGKADFAPVAGIALVLMLGVRRELALAFFIA